MSAPSSPRRKPKIQVLQLEPYDDVLLVKDQLRRVTQRRVILLFPAEGRILTRKLDLVLIQREAVRAGLQIALVTQDPDVAENAASLKLSCFYSVEQARRRRWRRGQTKVFIDREARPRTSIQHPYELMEVASRLRPALTPAQRRARWLGQGLLGLLLGSLALAVFMLLVPSAEVRLTPASDAIQEALTLTADPAASALDPQNAVLPAERLRLVVQGGRVTVESTGRRSIPQTLASGRVTFTNLTGQALFIPAGSIVSTRALPPVRFRTLADVPLAGAVGATSEVDIQALEDSAGFGGNLPVGAISRLEGELEASVSVQNLSPTSGGGVLEEVIVSQADHDRLLTLGRQAVLSAGRSELLLQLPAQNKFLVPNAVQIVEERPEWTVYSARVDDASANVSLELRAVIEALVVDEGQARQLAFLMLAERLPSDRELAPESLTYRREEVGFDEAGRYVFRLFVEGLTPIALDGDAIARRLSGLSTGRARQVLQGEYLLDPRYPPEVRVFPVNLGWMPFLPVRIEVEILRHPERG
jgi:hypothetical protein